jgi:hypothetical protein
MVYLVIRSFSKTYRMKIRAILLTFLVTSTAQANNSPISNPVYKYLDFNAEAHMKSLGFSYMQKLKLEVALKNKDYITYLNNNADKMTNEQILAENKKWDRMRLDEICLNLYFDEVTMYTMGKTVIERTKKTYNEDKKEIEKVQYDCDANLERILQGVKLLK